MKKLKKKREHCVAYFTLKNVTEESLSVASVILVFSVFVGFGSMFHLSIVCLSFVKYSGSCLVTFVLNSVTAFILLGLMFHLL